MKLAILGLFALSSAIEIRETVEVDVDADAVQPCIPRAESNAVFHDIDTNHNHVLGPKELYTAIENWARDTHRNLTPANVKWIEDHAAKDAATNNQDATMSKGEFFMFINQFVKYFKLPCAPHKNPPAPPKNVCVPRPDADNIFHILDTSHNHELNAAELYGAIEAWSRSTHRTLTAKNV